MSLSKQEVAAAVEVMTISPKQQQRREDQEARDAKKTLKRQQKALQKERNAVQKERKLAARERREEEARVLQAGLNAHEMEEQQRREEEQVLFAQEFLVTAASHPPVAPHTKKSAFDSNRLGLVVS